MFEPQIYIDRRKKLLERLTDHKGLLVFVGNEMSPMNYTANTFPFRQDSSFLYYFGLNASSLAAVVDLDSGTETLYGDDLTVEEIVWMGYQPRLIEKARRCGITATAGLAEFSRAVRLALTQQRKIHLLPQYQAQNILKLAKIMDLPTLAVQDQVSEPFTQAVIAMRSVKSAEEIEQIEYSVEIARQMHCAAMQTARPGMSENQLTAVMEQIVTGCNCRMAFPVIMTRHGEILHNHSSSDILRTGDLVINDSGVENPMGYASDITRTIPVGGRFTDRQREIYDLVLEALNRSIEKVTPGVEFKSIHLDACKILAEGLKGLGLMRGNPADAVVQGAHALFFQCGLGHMMGLDVHDMEGLNEQWVGYTDQIRRSEQFGLRSLRLAKALEPGYVITVEPGIYFIPALIEQWHAENKFSEYINYNAVQQYLDFGGIRIEDDVLVVPGGHRLLSGEIPKTAEAVEALCPIA